jgi:hypothetical protein
VSQWKDPDYGRKYYYANKEKYQEHSRKRYEKLKNNPEKFKERQQKSNERRKEMRRNKGEGKRAEALRLGYRSMFEVEIVEAAQEAGQSMEYEPHYIPYTIKGSYKPDFLLPNGIIVEAKGYLDAGTCRKMLAVKRSNPLLDIRFVFQNANGKRNKRAKLRNWEWAEKHGFPWAEGTIPLAWWKEEPREPDAHSPD